MAQDPPADKGIRGFLSLSYFTAQVPLLWHCSEGKFPILWCDVFQERSRLGERDRQERSEQADGGVFTPVQTWNIAARISECQRSKSTGQSARGKGEHACRTAGVGGSLSLSHKHTTPTHNTLTHNTLTHHNHTHNTHTPHTPYSHTPLTHTTLTHTTHIHHTHTTLTDITHTYHIHIHHTHTHHAHTPHSHTPEIHILHSHIPHSHTSHSHTPLTHTTHALHTHTTFTRTTHTHHTHTQHSHTPHPHTPHLYTLLLQNSEFKSIRIEIWIKLVH